MPITPTYPGVYIEEIPSGVRTITGVSTSIALFLGRTKKGAAGKPKLCLNFGDFERAFSSEFAGGDLARQVRMFFANGGNQCYVMRMAKDATQASVALQSESGTPVLTLTAKDAGSLGETLRAAVTYAGAQPEAAFNLELFRWVTDPTGKQVKQDQEKWIGLSMDPASARFAPDYIAQNSKLADAAATVSATPSATGFSQGGRPIAYAAGDIGALRAALVALFPANRQLRLSVNGSAFLDADLGAVDLATLSTANLGALQTAFSAKLNPLLNGVLPAPAAVNATLVPGPSAGGQDSVYLRIASAAGDVYVQPGPNPAKDLAVPLMLGTSQGGLEVSRYAAARPAPTGLVFNPVANLTALSALAQNAFAKISINGNIIDLTTALQTTAGGDPFYKDAFAASPNGNSDGVREKLGILQKAINDFAGNNPAFPFRAEVWGLRLALIPTSGGDNAIGSLTTVIAPSTTEIGGFFTANVRFYSVGAGGTAGKQTPAGAPASDGSAPDLKAYADAFDASGPIDKEVGLFNLLILPADQDHTAAVRDSLWGPASAFCERRRAFLLIDAPAEWTGIDKATDNSSGINKLRMGVVRDHSAVFYPRITVPENGLNVNIGPSGAIAGLMARIDGSRGVWKAPAGMEADIRGIAGLEQRFSDGENGVLNPLAINVLRSFPAGIVNWGARTLDGDDTFASEYKYIPVRRTALFIEESLFRGTQWVVFEPNDETLWAQIRLNVGSFMNTLFRQGAFQGTTPKEAFLVKCDAETTTQDDINRGVVNILVGFAPLKPAEFVIVKIQQLAGNLQT